MNLQGRLAKKLDITTGTSQSGNNWKKMTFVLDIKGKKPKQVAVDTFNDEVIRFINDTSIGSMLDCTIDIESREWNGKYFTNVNALKVETFREGSSPIIDQNELNGYANSEARKVLQSQPVDDNEDDGLPF